MRRLLLFFLLATAATAYNLVLQQFVITGGNVQNDVINCDTVTFLHVSGNTYDDQPCFKTMTDAEPPAVESITLVYTGPSITTKAAKIPIEILLKDGSTLTFDIAPPMKVGEMQTVDGSPPKFTSAETTTTTTTTTTTVPPTTIAFEAGKHDVGSGQCIDDKKHDEDKTVKAIKKTVARPAHAAAAASDDTVETIPLALRPRGPGPVRLPTPVSEDIEKKEEDDVRNKREADAAPADGEIDVKADSVKVTLYVLDEAGNPAAVWAAVIEGIILLVLVGLCIWVFFIAPRRRAAANGGVDPYKPDPNYSVSYNNTGYNQRIDAFQNPPAPPRPANNSYMDDYITDSVGAMSRPAAAAAAAPTTQQPTATNPTLSSFQPTHQRYDSSGLVTVNLS